MPYNPKLTAEATGFQQGCGLHALANAYVLNLKGNRLSPTEEKRTLELLFTAFKHEYLDAHDLTLAEFRKILVDDLENPIHREIILGPVLRRMLDNTAHERHRDSLEALDYPNYHQPHQPVPEDLIISLGVRLGMKVESYTTLRALVDGHPLVKDFKQVRENRDVAIEELPLVERKAATEARNRALAEVRAKAAAEIRASGMYQFEGEMPLRGDEKEEAEKLYRDIGCLRMGAEGAALPPGARVLKIFNEAGGHWEWEYNIRDSDVENQGEVELYNSDYTPNRVSFFDEYGDDLKDCFARVLGKRNRDDIWRRRQKLSSVLEEAYERGGLNQPLFQQAFQSQPFPQAGQPRLPFPQTGQPLQQSRDPSQPTGRPLQQPRQSSQQTGETTRSNQWFQHRPLSSRSRRDETAERAQTAQGSGSSSDWLSASINSLLSSLGLGGAMGTGGASSGSTASGGRASAGPSSGTSTSGASTSDGPASLFGTALSSLMSLFGAGSGAQTASNPPSAANSNTHTSTGASNSANNSASRTNANSNPATTDLGSGLKKLVSDILNAYTPAFTTEVGSRPAMNVAIPIVGNVFHAIRDFFKPYADQPGISGLAALGFGWLGNLFNFFGSLIGLAEGVQKENPDRPLDNSDLQTPEGALFAEYLQFLPEEANTDKKKLIAAFHDKTNSRDKILDDLREALFKHDRIPEHDALLFKQHLAKLDPPMRRQLQVKYHQLNGSLAQETFVWKNLAKALLKKGKLAAASEVLHRAEMQVVENGFVSADNKPNAELEAARDSYRQIVENFESETLTVNQFLTRGRLIEAIENGGHDGTKILAGLQAVVSGVKQQQGMQSQQPKQQASNATRAQANTERAQANTERVQANTDSEDLNAMMNEVLGNLGDLRRDGTETTTGTRPAGRSAGTPAGAQSAAIAAGTRLEAQSAGTQAGVTGTRPGADKPAGSQSAAASARPGFTPGFDAAAERRRSTSPAPAMSAPVASARAETVQPQQPAVVAPAPVRAEAAKAQAAPVASARAETAQAPAAPVGAESGVDADDSHSRGARRPGRRLRAYRIDPKLIKTESGAPSNLEIEVEEYVN